MKHEIIDLLIISINDGCIIDINNILSINCSNCIECETICKPVKGEVQSITLRCKIVKKNTSKTMFCKHHKMGNPKVKHQNFKD